MTDTRARRRFRSQEWFDNPNNPGMTALYIERYLNQEYTREELKGDRPVIGRIREGALILDLRCLSDDGALLAALA